MAEYGNIIDLDKLGRFHNNLKDKGLPLNDWQANKEYKIGYTVIQNGKFYRCKTEHTSTTTFDATKFDLVGGSSGTTISDWATGTTYFVGDLVIHDNNIYQCITSNSDSTWTPANWQKIGDEDFVGATSSSDGASGLVPKPKITDVEKYLKGDGTWGEILSNGVYATKTTLWRGTSYTQGDVLTLSDDYLNYDYIILFLEDSEGYVASATVIDPLKHCSGYCQFILNNIEHSVTIIFSTTIGVSSNTATLDYVKGLNSNWAFRNIEGIKFTQEQDFTGATSSQDGEHGLVPMPTSGDLDKFLSADGTWKEVSGSGRYATSEEIQSLFV